MRSRANPSCSPSNSHSWTLERNLDIKLRRVTPIKQTRLAVTTVEGWFRDVVVDPLSVGAGSAGLLRIMDAVGTIRTACRRVNHIPLTSLDDYPRIAERWHYIQSEFRCVLPCAICQERVAKSLV